MIKGFVRECTQCGKCCTKYNGTLGTIGKEEYQRLPEYAKEFCATVSNFYDIWINPVTGDEVLRCPFLRIRSGKHECTIQNRKPDVCRDYPVSIEQAIADGCEMVGDVTA